MNMIISHKRILIYIHKKSIVKLLYILIERQKYWNNFCMIKVFSNFINHNLKY